MTAKIVRAAAVQLNPVLDSADGTIAKVLQIIADGAAQGVQLMVFPETVVPYYPYFSFVTPAVTMGAAHLKLYEHSPTIPGPMTDAIGAAAKAHRMVVVLGVNERDHGTLYNAQIVFDVDGSIALKRRKITPTYHERMVWGMGDGSGLRTVQTAVGNLGALACWEHYNPLARYALMTQHEEIHCSQFPGSLVGPIFAEQMEVTMRHHALESGCFVVNATAWLTDAQKTSQAPTPELLKAFGGGCYTAIISPEGKHLTEPLREGEGMVIADLDMALVTKRKRMMDSVGHYARPELLSLNVDLRAVAPAHVASAPVVTANKPVEALRADPRDLEDVQQIAALMRQPRSGDSAQGAYLNAIAQMLEKAP